MRRRFEARAFTLIELLVVVSIIALLISILLPSLQAARQQAKAVLCQSNMHSFSLGAYTYATDFGRYAPSHASLRDIPGSGGAGMDWLGVGGHLNAAYVPAPPNNPKGGTPPGFDSAPTLGKLWPYVKSEKVFRCPSDKLVPIGSFRDSAVAYDPVSENWKFSFTMFACMGLRTPEEGAPSRMSDGVSGGPRGGGMLQHQLSKQSLAKTPLFVEEHPSGIGQFTAGHVEGTFNTGIDRVAARHSPYRVRQGYRPGTNTLASFKQGTSEVGFADGHVEGLATNHRFTDLEIKPRTVTGGKGLGGIPENADGLLYYFGLIYQEVHAQPGGGLKYDKLPWQS